MIVSFKHNYIYFRPKKTGSSTIEDVLSADLGPDDLIAGKRAKRLPGPGSKLIEEIVGHSRATEIRNLLPEDFWNGSFKFASERHPYEKAVSMAFYRYEKLHNRFGDKTKGFSDILQDIVEGQSYCGFKFYSIDGEPVVDDLIRHETLEQDLRRIGSKLGIAIPAEIPRKKGTFRIDSRPAREILSEEQRQTIYAKCQAEFDYLGYQP